jgi:RNA polymerase sigma factor (sigma-70 family)
MASTQGQPQSDKLAGESDADLLLYMSMAADDSAAATAAWEEFYRRHVDYLYAVSLRAFGPLLGGEPGVADLVADTLKRAYERAGTFNDGGIADHEKLRRRTRAWLGRIAQRLAMTALRDQARLPVRSIEPEQWQQIAEEPEDTGNHTNEDQRAALKQALSDLSEKEQLVLRVTFQWYRMNSEHQRLPEHVCAELAASLQTTPENLRQIRRRALQKLTKVLRLEV